MIFADGFDGAASTAWVSDDSVRTPGNWVFAGTSGTRIRRGRFLDVTIDARGYSGLRLECARETQRLDSGEFLTISASGNTVEQVTGTSGWISSDIDLSAYASLNAVTIRFEVNLNRQARRVSSTSSSSSRPTGLGLRQARIEGGAEAILAALSRGRTGRGGAPFSEGWSRPTRQRTRPISGRLRRRSPPSPDSEALSGLRGGRSARRSGALATRSDKDGCPWLPQSSPRVERSFSPSLDSARRSIIRTASSLFPPIRSPA